MKPIDRSPARLSSVVASGVSVVAALASGLYSWLALGVGGAGVAIVLGGLVLGYRSLVSGGVALLFVGALAAGVAGAPVGPLLVGAGATVVAWDVGRTAISVGTHLGRAANTVRIELLHIAATTVVAAMTVGSGYLLYDGLPGTRPLSVLVLSVAAAVLLLRAVNPTSRRTETE